MFEKVEDSRTAARDILYDFETGEDLIDLRGVDARADSTSTNNVFAFSDTEAAAYSVWWRNTEDGTGVVVSADVNGDTGADFQVRLAGVTQVTVDDFVL